MPDIPRQVYEHRKLEMAEFSRITDTSEDARSHGKELPGDTPENLHSELKQFGTSAPGLGFCSQFVELTQHLR
jgi:hypothetical protein